MSGKIRVLVADDHAIVRIGLKSVLEYEHDIEVVGEAKNRNRRRSEKSPAGRCRNGSCNAAQRRRSRYF